MAALFVGYARVQEGQHYLADVVASYALVAVACWSVSSARAPFGPGDDERSLRWLPYAHSKGAGVLAIAHY